MRRCHECHMSLAGACRVLTPYALALPQAMATRGVRGGGYCHAGMLRHAFDGSAQLPPLDAAGHDALRRLLPP